MNGPEQLAEPILSTLEEGIRVESHWRNASGRLHSVVVGRQHYIRNHDGSEELYDLVADPGQKLNLASSTDTRSLQETLDNLLRRGSG